MVTAERSERAEARHYGNDRRDGGRQMRLHRYTVRCNRFTRIKRHQAERVSRENGTLPTAGIRRGRVAPRGSVARCKAAAIRS